jgi:hypothetical protein
MNNVNLRRELPPDLVQVEERLRESRPRPSEAEMARIRLSVEMEMARMEAPARPHRANRFVLRSRVAIASMLVVGFVMSGAGAALGLSGISSSGSAGIAAYPTTTTGTTGTTTGSTTQSTVPQVLGTTGSTTPGGPGPQVLGETQSTPTTASTPTTPGPRVLGTEAQTTRQAAAEGAVKELPFTGIAAIPIILVGLALLMAGVLLRRSRLRADS